MLALFLKFTIQLTRSGSQFFHPRPETPLDLHTQVILRTLTIDSFFSQKLLWRKQKQRHVIWTLAALDKNRCKDIPPFWGTRQNRILWTFQNHYLLQHDNPYSENNRAHHKVNTTICLNTFRKLEKGRTKWEIWKLNNYVLIKITVFLTQQPFEFF